MIIGVLIIFDLVMKNIYTINVPFKFKLRTQTRAKFLLEPCELAKFLRVKTVSTYQLMFFQHTLSSLTYFLREILRSHHIGLFWTKHYNFNHRKNVFFCWYMQHLSNLFNFFLRILACSHDLVH